MFFKQNTSLGFDIGAGGVKLVEFKKEKKRPVLHTYGLTTQSHDIHKISEHQVFNVSGKKDAASLDIEKSAETIAAEKAKVKAVADSIDEKKIEDYASKIKDLYKGSKASSKSAIVSLPVSSIFHAIVTLPITKDKEELSRLVKAEVKKFVPFPLTEMSLDYQVLNNHKKKDEKAKSQKILVNAVPNKLISFYAKIFQKADITLDALEPESAALSRSLIGRDTSVSMIVDMGAERTNFFIIDQAVPITHQSIDFGGNKLDGILQNILGIEEDIVGQIKSDIFGYHHSSYKKYLSRENFLNIFLAVVDPIIKEINLSFELYARQMGERTSKPEKIILTGGMAFTPYLTEYISEKFQTKCYIGDPWARVVYQQALKPVLHKLGPRMAVAIGLALRNVV